MFSMRTRHWLNSWKCTERLDKNKKVHIRQHEQSLPNADSCALGLLARHPPEHRSKSLKYDMRFPAMILHSVT